FVDSLGPDLETRFAERKYAEVQQDEFTEWRMKVRRRMRGTGPAPHADVHRFRSVAVLPYWGRIRTYLEAERETRGRAVLAGGVESVLNELHPRINWRAPLLSVEDDHTGQTVDLFGEGLVIAPSLFAPGPM